MDESVPIYEIYVLEKPIKSNSSGILDFNKENNVGFFHDAKTARQAVKYNWADMSHNGLYKIAIIIKKSPGIYPFNLIQNYYIFNPQLQQYDKKEIPKELESWAVE